MEHNHNESHQSQYTIGNFLPLIIIVTCILLLTIIKAFISKAWDLHALMYDFMGFFFLVFGFFKVINLKNFVESYRTYDLIAQKSAVYAYAYPFIELTLGFFYLMRWLLTITNIVTLLIMLVSAVGVFNELRKGKTIVCACLGTVFKIPMTYVTLAEDLVMAAMALMMLFY